MPRPCRHTSKLTALPPSSFPSTVAFLLWKAPPPATGFGRDQHAVFFSAGGTRRGWDRCGRDRAGPGGTRRNRARARPAQQSSRCCSPGLGNENKGGGALCGWDALTTGAGQREDTDKMRHLSFRGGSLPMLSSVPLLGSLGHNLHSAHPPCIRHGRFPACQLRHCSPNACFLPVGFRRV